MSRGHSSASAGKTRAFCRYDAPAPEAFRSVDAIHEVSVLDPYFCH